MMFMESTVIGLAAFVGMFVAGAVLLIIWFRERVRWSEPYCLACKYDLRGRGPEGTQNCPECGADLHRRGAVGYMGRGRRPWLIWLSLGLILTPFVVTIIMASGVPWIPSSGKNAPTRPARQTPGGGFSQASASSNTPQGWAELTERVRAGTLDGVEAELVLRDFIKDISDTKPSRRAMVLQRQGDFLREAYRAGLFKQDALINLADAYYSRDAVIKGLHKVHVRERTVTVRIESGGSPLLSKSGGPPIDITWKLKGLTLDDKPVTYKIMAESSSTLIAMIDLPELDAGTYEVRATVDGAYVFADKDADDEQLAGAHDGQSKTLDRWQVDTKATLTVVGKNREAVTLSTDPSLDPGSDGVAPVYIAVQQRQNMKWVSVKLTMTGLYKGVLSYDVSIVLDGQWHDAGHFYYQSRENGWSRGEGPLKVWLTALDPSVTTADIVLTPNPKHAIRFLKADSIWGEPTTFKDFPIKRYDLNNSGNDDRNE